MFSKNLTKFQKLSNLPYFTTFQVADELAIKIESASVFCSRYAKKGFFTKLKKNFYVVTQKLDNLSKEEMMIIANMLQVPSYISFMTALEYYNISTQVQRNFTESCSLKRSIEYDIKGAAFKYYRIKKVFYSDFTRVNGLFIAAPEKAFIDAVYLYSFGKYRFDVDSLDLNKLDKSKLIHLIKSYPDKTKTLVKKLCRI